MRNRDSRLAGRNVDENQIDVQWSRARPQHRDEPSTGGEARGGLIPGAARVEQAVLGVLEVAQPQVEVDAVGAV